MQPFIIAAIGHHDAQHVIAVAGHQIAFHHLRTFHHLGLKRAQILILLPVQGDLHKDRGAAPQRRRADQPDIAFDHPIIFQPFQPPVTGRWRQSHLVREVGHTDPAISLNMGENLDINGIQISWPHIPPRMNDFMHETSK